jgi:hypothetical protein
MLHNRYILVCTDTKTTLESSILLIDSVKTTIIECSTTYISRLHKYENDYWKVVTSVKTTIMQLLCSMVYVRISVAGKEGHKVSICSTRRGPQLLICCPFCRLNRCQRVTPLVRATLEQLHIAATRHLRVKHR